VTRSDWSENAFFAAMKSGPTAVGHSHLDIQSFIIWKAAPLIIDPGIWPYGSFLGFFDSSPGGRRWDFDANATIAHNTVLVDGAGQTWGHERRGRITASAIDERLSCFVSDGAAVYPGLLTRFERWFIHVLPDLVLVYDDIASDRPRRWQWLLHTAVPLKLARVDHVLDSAGVTLSVKRLLPPAETPWRNVEETRTSYYQDSDTLRETSQSIHLYRFGPMFPSEKIEFLWAMHLGGPETAELSVERKDDNAFAVTAKRGKQTLTIVFDRSARRCTLT
jgi:hypothetical protein